TSAMIASIESKPATDPEEGPPETRAIVSAPVQPYSSASSSVVPSSSIGQLHDRNEQMAGRIWPGMDAMHSRVHRVLVAHVEKRFGILINVAALDPQP